MKSLGIRLGTTTLGYAVVDINNKEDKDIKILEILNLRTRFAEITANVAERAMYRRGRRSRKLRYRMPRFSNRKKGGTFLSNRRLKLMIKIAIQNPGLITPEELAALKQLRNARKNSAHMTLCEPTCKKGEKEKEYEARLKLWRKEHAALITAHATKKAKLKNYVPKYNMETIAKKLGVSTEYQPRKADGWIAPSLRALLHATLKPLQRLVEKYHPDRIVLEDMKFDFQKLDDPFMAGERYQRGNLYLYNRKLNYCINRQKSVCAICNEATYKVAVKNEYGKHLTLHHITPTTQGGSDSVNNLVMIHKTCHESYHVKYPMETSIKLKKDPLHKKHIDTWKSRVNATQVNIIRKRVIEKIKELYPNIELVISKGYITKTDRQYYELPMLDVWRSRDCIEAMIVALKDVNMDVIADPTTIEKLKLNYKCSYIEVHHTRKKKRSLHDAKFKPQPKNRLIPIRTCKNIKTMISPDGRKWTIWDRVLVIPTGEIGYITQLKPNDGVVTKKTQLVRYGENDCKVQLLDENRFQVHLSGNVEDRLKLRVPKVRNPKEFTEDIKVEHIKLLGRNNNFVTIEFKDWKRTPEEIEEQKIQEAEKSAVLAEKRAVKRAKKEVNATLKKEKRIVRKKDKKKNKKV